MSGHVVVQDARSAIVGSSSQRAVAPGDHILAVNGSPLRELSRDLVERARSFPRLRAALLRSRAVPSE